MHIVPGQRHRIYTVQKPTQNKKKKKIAQWTDARRPILQLWIRSTEVWGGGGGQRHYDNGTITTTTTRLRKNPYCSHGYIPLRFVGNVVMRMGTQQHYCAKKKSLRKKKKKNQRFLSKKARQTSLTTKK